VSQVRPRFCALTWVTLYLNPARVQVQVIETNGKGTTLVVAIELSRAFGFSRWGGQGGRPTGPLA